MWAWCAAPLSFADPRDGALLTRDAARPAIGMWSGAVSRNGPIVSWRFGTAAARRELDVDLGVEGVLLNELAARLHDVAHQFGEKIVGIVRVMNLHLQ